jgi:response regulator RpfG family c-di-GMP phosphodiesterase
MIQSEAMEEIKKCAATQFDPELAEAFIAMMDKIAEYNGSQEGQINK